LFGGTTVSESLDADTLLPIVDALAVEAVPFVGAGP
jgi:hypothetical protein